jgi:hypothetical protein
MAKVFKKSIFAIYMSVAVKDTALWDLGLSDFTASHPEEDFFVLDLNHFVNSTLSLVGLISHSEHFFGRTSL